MICKGSAEILQLYLFWYDTVESWKHNRHHILVMAAESYENLWIQIRNSDVWKPLGVFARQTSIEAKRQSDSSNHLAEMNCEN